MNTTTSSILNFAAILTSSSGGTCFDDATCPILYKCVEGLCKHKEIFPLEPRECFGSILMTLLVGVANAGGMGGSFIAAPILMIIFNYSPAHAIRLVYCVVFGGSLGNFAINFLAKRQSSLKPLIDYDVSLIALPMLLCGTSVGVLMNSVTPPFVVIFGLVAVMGKSVKKLWIKIIKQYREENKPKERTIEVSTEFEIELKEVGDNKARNEDYQAYFMVVHNPRAYHIFQEDRLQIPWRKFKEFFILLTAILGLFLLRGTSSFGSILGIGYCSTGYWACYIFTLLICFIFERRARKSLLEAADLRNNVPLTSASDFTITPASAVDLRNVSLIGGVLAGFLGIGGGTIMNPKMLDMGLSCESAAATSGFFVIFTGFLSMFQTLIYGGLSFTEIVFFCPLAFIGSMAVTVIVRKLVKKYQRPSFIMVCVLMSVLIGVLAIPCFSVYRAIENPAMMTEVQGLC
mgnify:CR=1 FL=1